MKTRLFAILILVFVMMVTAGMAEIMSVEEVEPEATHIPVTTEYRWFTGAYRNTRSRKVSYYDNVYAVNHGEYLLQPFSSDVPEEYFVMDDSGTLALAPIVLDITDAMRERLYGADVGETALFFGQYCEKILDKKGRYGFSGVHEGIDFVNEKGVPLYAILGGTVTRAGDRNGTVGIYNEEYDVTVLYLHCQNICVKRGQQLEAGAVIANEGSKAIYAGSLIKVDYMNQGLKHVHTSHYVHVEVRFGRHTTSNPYRNVILESDCPYAVMQQALGVLDSGRQPVTMAAVNESQRMREEAEARARAEAEAAAALAAATPTPEPEIEIIENPEANAGYGFGEETTAPEATPTPAPVVEATLPPTNL